MALPRGIGYAVYLPDEDANYPQTVTHKLFEGAPTCISVAPVKIFNHDFVDYTSMSHFVETIAKEAGINSSYKEAVFFRESDGFFDRGIQFRNHVCISFDHSEDC